MNADALFLFFTVSQSSCSINPHSPHTPRPELSIIGLVVFEDDGSLPSCDWSLVVLNEFHCIYDLSTVLPDMSPAEEHLISHCFHESRPEYYYWYTPAKWFKTSVNNRAVIKEKMKGRNNNSNIGIMVQILHTLTLTNETETEKRYTRRLFSPVVKTTHIWNVKM